MKLIQLIKDFRKWRGEKYDAALSEVCKTIAGEHYSKTNFDGKFVVFFKGLYYGIKHRKEILKKVKI